MITVLWEDQRDVQLNSFKPHALLVRAVADDLEREHWHVERVLLAKAMKGNAKVLDEIRRNGPSLRMVFAVLDEDQIHRLTSQPKDACVATKADALAKLVANVPAQVHPRLLVRNVESILEAIAAVKGMTVPAKNPNARDAFIEASGLLKAAARDERAKVRAECPSFDKLAKRVAEVAAPLLKVTP